MDTQETKTENNLTDNFKQVKENLEKNSFFRVAVNGLVLAAGIGISFTSLGAGLPILGLVLPNLKKISTEGFIGSLKDAAASIWNKISGNKEDSKKLLETANPYTAKTENKPDFLTKIAATIIAGTVTGILAVKNIAGYLWNKITGSTETATQEPQEQVSNPETQTAENKKGEVLSMKNGLGIISLQTTGIKNNDPEKTKKNKNCLVM